MPETSGKLELQAKKKKGGGGKRDILTQTENYKISVNLSVWIYVCLSVCLLFFSDNTVEVVMSSNLIGLKKSKRLQIKQF